MCSYSDFKSEIVHNKRKIMNTIKDQKNKIDDETIMLETKIRSLEDESLRIIKNKNKIQKIENTNEIILKLLFSKNYVDITDFINSLSTYEELHDITMYHLNYSYNNLDRKSSIIKLLSQKLLKLIEEYWNKDDSLNSTNQLLNYNWIVKINHLLNL